MSEPTPETPAQPAKKQKPKPTGVEVNQRTIMVGKDLQPMEDKHQTRVPWKESKE